MGMRYFIKVYNSSGVEQGEIDIPQSLSYDLKNNKKSVAVFEVSGAHALVETLIAHDSIIAIYRGDPEINLDDYCDWVGVCQDYQQFGYSPSVLKVFAESSESLLERRHVMFLSGTENKSKFLSGKAETIMKTLVDYNITSLATTGNGRLRAGSLSGKTITTETDGANGNTLNWYCAFDNLLETIQGLADIGGGDFEMDMTSPGTWDFKWHTGQRGTDRTSTVIFSIENGTMSMPNFTVQRSGEKTVAVVGGQGVADERDTVVRTGTNYSAANDKEIFVDARDIEDGETDALEDRGDKKLAGFEAFSDFQFEVIQTSSLIYGRDYFLGDKVQVVNPYTGIASDRKIIGILIDFVPDGTQIVRVENEPA